MTSKWKPLKAREDLAKRVWPTQDHWQEFLKHSGKGNFRTCVTIGVNPTSIVEIISKCVQSPSKNFSKKYKEVWHRLERNENVPEHEMDNLRLLIILPFMSVRSDTSGTTNPFWLRSSREQTFLSNLNFLFSFFVRKFWPVHSKSKVLANLYAKLGVRQYDQGLE